MVPCIWACLCARGAGEQGGGWGSWTSTPKNNKTERVGTGHLPNKINAQLPWAWDAPEPAVVRARPGDALSIPQKMLALFPFKIAFRSDLQIVCFEVSISFYFVCKIIHPTLISISLHFELFKESMPWQEIKQIEQKGFLKIPPTRFVLPTPGVPCATHPTASIPEKRHFSSNK